MAIVDETDRLERSAGVALWRQIEAQLATEIGRGAYAADAPFPTEAALARRFEVNRHTVRRAIAALSGRGLMRVEQGRGTFLVEHAISYALGSRTRFSENLLQQGRQPAHEVLRLLEVPASPEAALALGLAASETVVLFETIGFADGLPISLSTTCFPPSRSPGVAAALQAHGSITAALEAIGHGDYRRRSTRITARQASGEERQLLRLIEGRAVLVSESVNVDRNDLGLSFAITRFAADRVQLVLET